MNIGDKVIITGGTEKDWDEYYGKPYYMTYEADFNRVCKSYKDKEILEIIEKYQTQYPSDVYNLKTYDGEIFSGFYEWELKTEEKNR